jgi:ribosomal protein S18 acetylase RimI-like enzyme
MIADLTKLAEDYPWPAGLSVQIVSDVEALHNWVKIVARSYNQPRRIARSLFELYSAQAFGPHRPFRLFVGSSESHPVAAALLLSGIHSSGIYNVGTLPKARRHGFGAALTRHAMLEARALGYPIAALVSTAMGVGIYQRLGFEECCLLELYRIKKTPRKQPSSAGHSKPGRRASQCAR